jgi:hypothetical protein
MSDPLSSFAWVIRAGPAGPLSFATLVLLIGTTVWVLFRKPANGYFLILAFARVQLLLALMAVNGLMIFFPHCLVYRVAARNTMWMLYCSYMLSGLIANLSVIFFCVIAVIVRYRKNPQLTLLDTLGITAAMLSVILNALLASYLFF